MEQSEEDLRRIARDVLRFKVNHWRIFQTGEKQSHSTPAPEELSVPTFDAAEIELRVTLGSGNFCTVHEISNVALLARSKRKDLETESPNDPTSMSQQAFKRYQTRQFMASNYRRGRYGRYALKTLTHDQVVKPGDEGKLDFIDSVVDLALEAKILTKLNDHPNIIKIRGIMECESYCDKSFFIVLDRLYDTLAECIKGKWKKKHNRLTSFAMLTDYGGTKRKGFYAERLKIGYYIASALDHIHKHRLLYRDLKPQNTAFDIRGDIKLFDFGLVRELPYATSLKYKKVPNKEVYNMTSFTGSFRYMAPEVNREPAYYNQSMDVYSFGILLWQIIFIETPFKSHVSPKHHMKQIAEGKRPPLHLNNMLQWSTDGVLDGLLTKCWSANLTERPSMSNIMIILKEEIARAYGRGHGSDHLDITSRSLHSIKLSDHV